VVELPPIANRAEPGATVSIPVAFAALRGDTVRVSILDVRKERTTETFSREQLVLPVAIAEVGIPGVRRGTPTSPKLPSECRSDLIAINGVPVVVRVDADRATAERGDPFPLVPCGAGVRLPVGDSELRTTAGGTTAIDVDRVMLASAVGGSAATPGPVFTGEPPAQSPLRIIERGPVTTRAVVDQPAGPFWFVLGQSANAGWRLKVEGGTASPRTLVNGFANGWLITPDGSGRPVKLAVEWTPQRVVFAAIAISGFTMLACTAIVVASMVLVARRRSRYFEAVPSDLGLRWPLVDQGVAPMKLGPLAVRVAAVAAVGWLVAGWIPAAAVTFAAMVFGLKPAWRWWAPVVSAGIVVGIGATMVVLQVRYEYPPVFEWPTYFAQLHPIGWIAILLLPLPWILNPRSFWRE
jgi:arabinofuranan 3-O-arabinosyltransferase